MTQEKKSSPFQIEVIRRSRLFDDIDEALYLPFLEQCSIRRVKAGDVLITPGQENQLTYFVLTGSLSIHLEKPDNPPIRRVAPGETVGELSLFGETTATAYVIVEESGRTLVLNQDAMWGLIDGTPLFARNLLYILSGWIVSDNRRFIDRSRQIEKFKGLAQLDGLTGLLNRRSLDDILARLFQRREKDGSTLSVIMLDADHFKKYNDTYGHNGGDQALIALAGVMKETIRPGDLAARYGGEEFSVILPDANLKEAALVAERLLRAVEQTEIFMPDGSLLGSITISLGVAEAGPESTPESLLEAADAKLYQAKNEGRNRFCS